MISAEVQRTLVKSPPELWTELSDPASLARHLGEFGEIRITRLEPERTVAWEGESATGEILIKPSGWGTRVTLRVTRAPEAGSAETDAEPGADARAAEVPAEPRADAGAAEVPPGVAGWAADLRVEAPDSDAFSDELDHAPEAAGLDVARAVDVEDAATGIAEDTAAAHVAGIEDSESAVDTAAVGEAAPDFWPVPAAATWAAQLREPADDGTEAEPPRERAGEDWSDPAAHAAERPLEQMGFFARLFRRARRRTGELGHGGDLGGWPMADDDGEPADESTEAPDAFEEDLDVSAHEAVDHPPVEHAPLHEPDLPGAPDASGEPEADFAAEASGEPEADFPREMSVEPDASGAPQATVEPDASMAPETTLAPSPAADGSREPQTEQGLEPAPADEAGEEQTRAVLSSMLDRLGTAHHRPFSRG